MHTAQHVSQVRVRMCLCSLRGGKIPRLPRYTGFCFLETIDLIPTEVLEVTQFPIRLLMKGLLKFAPRLIQVVTMNFVCCTAATNVKSAPPDRSLSDQQFLIKAFASFNSQVSRRLVVLKTHPSPGFLSPYPFRLHLICLTQTRFYAFWKLR